jgi:hypothetical protein
MQFTIVLNPNSPHQSAHQTALQSGLKALGVDAVLSRTRVDTKYVACWGWRQGQMLRSQGHEVLVLERGYLGDRFVWSSLGWNGLNGYADFSNPPDDGGERFNAHYEMAPWRETDGKYVLIMGQVPGDASLRGKNLMPWYESVGVLAADAYGLPVKFRPHPNTERKGIRQVPRHCQRSFEPLDEAIADAHVVITYNSNSAVDAVVRGVPAIAMDEGSMAWDVTGHQIGDIVRPDRSPWASKLAWTQWSLDEIRSGAALERLLSNTPLA